MSTTAATTRHLATLHRGAEAWHWAALKVGHVQPPGYRNYRHSRWYFQLHVTPVHVARYVNTWEFGVCLGKRTLFVLRHR